MRSFNDWYFDLFESGNGACLNQQEIAEEAWDYQQSKVDELQRRNQMLNDNIKEQGQKLVYQNEVIETQAEKLLGLRNEKAELQKRVDAVNLVLEGLKNANYMHSGNKAYNSLLIEKLEQALKGGIK